MRREHVCGVGALVRVRRAAVSPCRAEAKQRIRGWSRAAASTHGRAARGAQIWLWDLRHKAERHGNHRSDVRLRAVDLEAQAKPVARSLHLAQALKIVGAGAADPDLDLVLLDVCSELLQGLDEALDG